MSQHLLQLLALEGLALLRSHPCEVYHTPVFLHFPLQLATIQRLEEVLVIHLKFTILQPLVCNPDILIVVAHLIGMRIQTTVWSDDAVAVEVVIGGRIASVVPTIGENLLARNLALVAQALIDKVPDKATLIFRILANEVPILLETTHRVAHSVSILTLDERTGIIRLGVLLAVGIIIVHRTEDIRLAPMTGLFILDGAYLVNTFHPVIDLFEVRTIACLIAHAPDDDARMIAEGEHIALIALQVHLGKVCPLSQGTLTITHAVTFEVRLCHHIKTGRVAKLIPTRIVRIVRGAHRIDVQLFHNADVLLHTLNRDDITTIGVELMTIYTFY